MRRPERTSTCAYGGVKIDTGIDLDSNQKLSDDEIDNYCICVSR